jgi:hypothetical protein
MFTIIGGYMKFLIVLFCMTVAAAFAVEASVPEINPLTALGELVLNYNSLSSMAKGILFVNILVQVVKQASDFQHKRLLVVLFSVVYGVLEYMSAGGNFVSAFVAVLISGGGAMALYESAKPLLKNISFLKIGK